MKMKSMKGIVKRLSIRDQRFGILLDNGNWYNGFIEFLPKDLREGCIIEFDYQEKNNFRDIIKGTLRVIESQRSGENVVTTSRDAILDASIKKQVALKCATEIIAKITANVGDDLAIGERVIKLAEFFEKWLTTDKSTQKYTAK